MGLDSDRRINSESAFSFFASLCRRRFKEEHPDSIVPPVTEFFKPCRERWRGLNERQKLKFYMLAEKERELDPSEEEEEEEEENGTKSTTEAPSTKKKKAKTPVEPKKPRNPYTYFVKDQHADLAARGGSEDMAQVNRDIAARWRRIGPEEKARYAAMAKHDKVRYEREIRKYRQSRIMQ